MPIKDLYDALSAVETFDREIQYQEEQIRKAEERIAKAKQDRRPAADIVDLLTKDDPAYSLYEAGRSCYIKTAWGRIVPTMKVRVFDRMVVDVPAEPGPINPPNPAGNPTLLDDDAEVARYEVPASEPVWIEDTRGGTAAGQVEVFGDVAVASELVESEVA